MKKTIISVILIAFLFSCKNLPDKDGRALPDTSNVKEKKIEGTLEEVQGTEKLAEIEEIKESEEIEGEEEIEELTVIEEEDRTEELAEIEEIEDTEEIAEESSGMEEKIDELNQMVQDLQAQLDQLKRQPQPSIVQAPPAPPPVPAPALTPPAVQTPPAEPVMPEQEPPVADTPRRTHPVERENPQVPTPSTSMIVPLDRNNEVIFSRIVRATVGQIIEIPFRGTGWVFLGELASRRGVAYDSRRNDPEGYTFIFKAEQVGTYALKFSRQDFIRDYILNDHVQVVVGEAPVASTGWFGPDSDPGRIVAQPRWPSASEEAEILRGEPSRPVTVSPPYQPNESQTSSSATEREPSAVSTAPPASREQPGEPVQSAVSPVAPNASTDSERIPEPPKQEEVIPREQLVQRAKDTFETGNVQGAISLLDQYIASFPTGAGDDELYWLYGQFYEANSPARDIKLSLEYYKKLTAEFPQSNRFNDARRRIAYLERFYINIR